MITYANEPCIDPLALAESLLAQDPPLPLEPWFGRANSFRSTLGCKTGRGMVIMSLDALTRLYNAGTDSTANTLKFSDEGEPGLSLKGIIIEGYDAIAPGAENDRQQAFAVKLVDRRHVFAKIPINQAYNVRGSPGGAFTTATQNSGVDWTWATMVGDIWGKVAGLGAFTSLPFTPDGTPEGWKFYGGKAMDALSSVLTRLSCALKYDHLLDTFSIVRVGVASSTATANVALLKQTLTRIWDSYSTEPKYANLPRAARICFRKQPRPTDGTSDVYTIDVTDPVDTDLTQRLTGSVVQVWDDLTAYYVAGVLDNSAALTTRATERAADYFRALHAVYADSETYVYRGVQRKAIASVGSLFFGWTVLDNGEGLKTELFRGQPVDGLKLEDWHPVEETLPTVEITRYGKACPTFTQISDGSGSTISVVTSITQETWTETLSAGTVVGSVTCVVNEDDCCDVVLTLPDSGCNCGVSYGGTSIPSYYSFCFLESTGTTGCGGADVGDPGTPSWRHSASMLYNGLCAWTATNVDGMISTLECLTDAGTVYMYLTVQLTAETLYYRKTIATWNWFGNNTMTIVTSPATCVGWPSTIVVSDGYLNLSGSQTCTPSGGGTGDNGCCPSNPWAASMPIEITGYPGCGGTITGNIVYATYTGNHSGNCAGERWEFYFNTTTCLSDPAGSGLTWLYCWNFGGGCVPYLLLNSANLPLTSLNCVTGKMIFTDGITTVTINP